ncbi:TolC family protein [bacterium]|nr:TolC family protein [bacterium]
MHTRILLLLSLLGWSSCFGQATLPEMVCKALANNPGLTIAQSEALTAAEQVAQATADRLPALEMSGSYRRQSMVPELRITPIELPFGAGLYSPIANGAVTLGTLDTYDLRLTLSQPIFTGFRLSNRVSAARSDLAARNSEILRQRAELIYQVEAAYGQVLKTEKYMAIARAGREQIAGHLRDARNLLNQGLLKKEELLQVQVHLSEADLAVLQAENSHAMSLAVLENLLGEKIAPEVTFSPLPPTSGETADLQSAVNVAFANRAELKTVSYTQEVNRALVAMAQAGRLPAVAAFGSVGYGRPGLDMLKKEWMDYWVVGVGLEWKLWNGGKVRSQVQQAKINGTMLEDRDRQLREAIRLEVTNAYLQWQEAVQRQQLNAILQSQAEESYRVAEHQYQQGHLAHSSYFDSQTALMRARMGMVQAEIDCAVSLAALRRAEGVNEIPYRVQ